MSIISKYWVVIAILFLTGCSHLQPSRNHQQASIPSALPLPKAVPPPNKPRTYAPVESPAYGYNSLIARQKVTTVAHQLIGSPYRYGGTAPSGFDCSGFTQFVFKQANIKIPRTAALQRDATQTVSSLRQLIPGDLIFFKTSANSNHVGIYVGNEQFIHTSTGQKKVRKSNLQNNYWRKHFVKFGRFITSSNGYARLD